MSVKSALCDEEIEVREKWKRGSLVEIYSDGQNKWLNGLIYKIFTDDEGEWLEVRYDKSAKQVQRFCSEIRPSKGTIKPKPLIDNKTFAEDDPNIKARNVWKQGSFVEIYSNTYKRWYKAKIVKIMIDDEGEWLNVIWMGDNQQSMGKQIQRYSDLVRPVERV